MSNSGYPNRPNNNNNTAQSSSSSAPARPKMAAHSSQTLTALQEDEIEDDRVVNLILQPRPSNNVTFDQSVIDNENMNKKSSKKCCIYHKPKEFGESSSESDFDSELDGDSSNSSDREGAKLSKNSKDIKRLRVERNKKGSKKKASWGMRPPKPP